MIEWVIALGSECRLRIPVRVVKGAYWDTEIKRAQVLGLDSYPVFTRKAHTDVSYLACVRRMLGSAGMDGALFPMFATHNAHTAAAIVEGATQGGIASDAFEFQRLHGMGEALYDEIVSAGKLDIACRVYAPVGSHPDLLPYLDRPPPANPTPVSRCAPRAARRIPRWHCRASCSPPNAAIRGA